MDHVNGLLWDWWSSVPDDILFSPSNPTAALDRPVLVRYDLDLFAAYYCCIFGVHGVFLHDNLWMERLSTYGRECNRTGGDMDKLSLPFPTHWGQLVTDARTCIDLLG